MTGIFITIDGPDGSGKSLQARLLAERLRAERLRAEGRAVLLTREPSDGPISRLIRQALTGQVEIAGDAMGQLFAADRIDHLEREVLPALARGEVVISDRYTWSNLVYRVVEIGSALFRCSGCRWAGDTVRPGEGAPWRCPKCRKRTVGVTDDAEERIAWARALTPDIRTANLTLILSVSPDVAAARRQARGGAPERYEADAFQARCCALYGIAEELALEEERVVVLDASRGVDAVADAVWWKALGAIGA